MIADLHVHTSHTDCSEDPVSVFRMAKENGVTHLAITDHDTLYGIDDNRRIAEKTGIVYIPGIEISAYDQLNKKKCHIIGLFVKEGHGALEKVIDEIAAKRNENSMWQIKKLSQMGYDINEDDFVEKKAVHGIYKQHIMRVLLDKGIVDEMFGEFYHKIFGSKGLLNKEISYPSHTMVVRILRDAGAFPVLVHPTVSGNMENIKQLVINGLQGIEINYPSVTTKVQKQILEKSGEYKLFLSGGSDFHGLYGTEKNSYVGSHFVTNLDILIASGYKI
jgi:phosphoribosyl 1,2-cyclic phosphate 1,2-diphosphodiesterase